MGTTGGTGLKHKRKLTAFLREQSLMNLDQFLKKVRSITGTLATVTSLFVSNVVKTQPTVANTTPPPVAPQLLTKISKI